MDTPANLHYVKSPDHFKELLSEDLQRVSLLYFWAPWAEPCKQMTEVVAELSRKYQQLLSLQIEAEEQSEIAESFEIESVPTFIVLRVRYTSTSSLRISPPGSNYPGSHFTWTHHRSRRPRAHHGYHEPSGAICFHHAAFSFRQASYTSTSRGEDRDA